MLALVIATLVRQMWFENYEIPTGSMRPTFMEQDHLTVSKTQFGINVPLETKHFYFDPNLVQRTSIFIFSAENMRISDIHTTYFWVLPYTKRLIKRMIGRPGDSIYFYGGKLYGVDKDGNPLTELIDSPWMKRLEYIPFLSFEGEVSSQAGSNQILFHQMNKPVGKLTFLNYMETVGEVFNGKEWVKDKPIAQKEAHKEIETYTDFWGMRNYAMARLLTKQQLRDYSDADITDLEDGILYLELRHNPSLTYPKPILHHENLGLSILLTPYVSIIPLQKQHLDAIMENMYTARFVVNNGIARRYSVETGPIHSSGPHFPGLEDGTYEFYFGKGYQVGWGAITYELPKNNPLYSHEPGNVQKLYNQGMEMSSHFEPHSRHQALFPHRYAYFRDGDLYLLGAPIFKKDDPALVEFLKREEKKSQQSSANRPYIPFKDYGSPEKEGKYDLDFIRTFGITVPDKHYLALGDNHAISGDSRVFGFVPEDNIQGSPCLIVWPPGDRLGHPPQKPYPVFVLPRMIVWSIVGVILIIWYLIYLRNIRRPIFRERT